MLTMTTDVVIQLGRQHQRLGNPCQDHALAGHFPAGGAYAVIADGCSHGGQTDLGARLTTLATRQLLAEENGSASTPAAAERFGERLAARLALSQELLGLTPADLLATSGGLRVSPQEGAMLRLFGDGAYATVSQTGEVALTLLAWRDNRPFYPIYHQVGLADFLALQGQDPATPSLTWTRWRGPREALVPEAQGELSLAEGIRGYRRVFSPAELAELQLIVLFTDGLQQLDPYDVPTAASRLLDFKSLAGTFVKRRVAREVRELAKVGLGPRDDLGIAAICLTQTPED